MSFLPGFQDDLFISYAHIDDQPLVEGHKGWISQFHRALEVRLRQLLGAEAKIWRDPKLQGNDYFADTLVMQLPKIGVMVSVLSPRYVRSDWCMKELQEFLKHAEQSGCLRIDNKARIFKVVKTYIPLEKHPPELQGLLGYEFFQLDPATGRPREFNPELGSSMDRNFWAKLEDLAYDIYQLLERLKSQERSEDPAAAPSGTTIYLAETTFDLSLERDKIKRELQQRGHTVLPDRPLPLNAPDFQSIVRYYLQQCQLSIHLIGEKYGIIPESESRSIVCLQNELAAERSSDPSFSRLIWIPAGLTASDERQKEFVRYLQYDSSAQKGADLLQTTLEDLKTVILDKLAARQEPPAEPTPQEEGPVRIYLICDGQDLDSVVPLEDCLYHQGFEVILPATEGDEAQVREDHKENLLLCDAILIYCGNASELWLRTKLRDLQKMAGYGRTKPVLASAIYVSGPETPAKQRFRTHEASVIKHFGTFSPESLKPFFEQIQNRKGGGR